MDYEDGYKWILVLSTYGRFKQWCKENDERYYHHGGRAIWVNNREKFMGINPETAKLVIIPFDRMRFIDPAEVDIFEERGGDVAWEDSLVILDKVTGDVQIGKHEKSTYTASIYQWRRWEMEEPTVSIHFKPGLPLPRNEDGFAENLTAIDSIPYNGENLHELVKHEIENQGIELYG